MCCSGLGPAPADVIGMAPSFPGTEDEPRSYLTPGSSIQQLPSRLQVYNSGTGPPTTGQYAAGTECIDSAGNQFVCLIGGIPGTWASAGGGSASVTAADLAAAGGLTSQLANQANGPLILDSVGKISLDKLPALPSANYFTAGSQASMLALSAGKGDICIRTDVGAPYAQYVLGSTPASSLSNWLGIPSQVQSVDNRLGPVMLTDRYPVGDTSGGAVSRIWTHNGTQGTWAAPPAGSAALGSFTLPGQAVADTYISAPGAVVGDAVTLDSADIRLFEPPLGSAMILRLHKLSGGTFSQIGSNITIPAGTRRAVVTGMATALSMGDEARCEVVSTGFTRPGGNSIQVTLASSGVTWPVVASAPAPVTNFTATTQSGSVLLAWTASANTSEYFVYRDNTLLTVLRAGQTTYVDPTGVAGQSYTYKVGAANTSAMSSLVTATGVAASGAFYTGDKLLTAPSVWTVTTGSAPGASLVNSGTDGVFSWTSASSGVTGSKAMRLAADQGVNAAFGKAIHTYKVRWGQNSGGWRFGVRRTAADDFGILVDLGYSTANNLVIRVKKTGDGTHNTAKQIQYTGTTTVSDIWVEIYDDPTAGVYEVRCWVDGAARPSTATLAVVSGDTYYAAMGDASIATGRAKVEQNYVAVNSAQTLTLRQATYALIA